MTLQKAAGMPVQEKRRRRTGRSYHRQNRRERQSPAGFVKGNHRDLYTIIIL